MIDERFWGYMFAPNCFIRFKTFGLWTKEESFMKTFLPKEALVYVEEREEALDCSMAHNVSMLADGQLSLCCLDYEGEMGLPNLRDTSVVELLRSPQRTAIAKDSMKAEVCRRCQGNLFVFDTEAASGAAVALDKFGRGWHPFEPDMNGIGGRWSNGEAWTYLLARQDNNLLALRFLSVHDSASPLTVQLREYDEASKQFGIVLQEQTFFGTQNQVTEVELPLHLRTGKMYRIDLLSPTFTPGEPDGGGDQRKLGLVLFDATMRHGESTLPALPAELPPPEREPIQEAPVEMAEETAVALAPAAAVATPVALGTIQRWLNRLVRRP
ncbi:SPASM domain-containing protein [Rugamonas sp.]|uniref:SPASM domain-containing protein n=1 Tax=Rugamonas sp. TaxID=1926287 RepID=UPI0025EC1CA2|nr:SPASM domain-containing protein [Rugamonas sp.]